MGPPPPLLRWTALRGASGLPGRGAVRCLLHNIAALHSLRRNRDARSFRRRGRATRILCRSRGAPRFLPRPGLCAVAAAWFAVVDVGSRSSLVAQVQWIWCWSLRPAFSRRRFVAGERSLSLLCSFSFILSRIFSIILALSFLSLYRLHWLLANFMKELFEPTESFESFEPWVS